MGVIEKYKRPLFTGLLVGLAITIGLLVFADIREVSTVFRAMDLRYLPLILILAPLNYIFRFIKWNYFLKINGIKPDPLVNRYIFMSGLSMTITPGKVGELLKCYLLKEHIGAPVSQTSSIVLAERVTDGLAMVILFLIGIMAFPYGRNVVTVAAILLVLLIILFQFEVLFNYLLDKLSRFTLFRKSAQFFREFFQSARLMFSGRSLVFAVGIGVISWGFEGLIVFLAVKAFGGEISIFGSFFVIALSSLAGALSFLPGGLGVAEGSIMAVLLLGGISTQVAAATTLLTRFSTLWLGVAIGLIGLLFVQKSLKTSEENSLHKS
jgi:glycosyltransferase 2 family protein